MDVSVFFQIRFTSVVNVRRNLKKHIGNDISNFSVHTSEKVNLYFISDDFESRTLTNVFDVCLITRT